MILYLPMQRFRSLSLRQADKDQKSRRYKIPAALIIPIFLLSDDCFYRQAPLVRQVDIFIVAANHGMCKIQLIN